MNIRNERDFINAITNGDDIRLAQLHCEKNGGWIHTLLGDGLYFWYSGKTAKNTTGCLMAYELNMSGQDAWHLNFSKNLSGEWNVVSCRNTRLVECRAIAAGHYANANESFRLSLRERTVSKQH